MKSGWKDDAETESLTRAAFTRRVKGIPRLNAGDAGIRVLRGGKRGCFDSVFDWTVDDEVLTAIGCCFTHFRFSFAAKMPVRQRDGVIVLNADVNSLSDNSRCTHNFRGKGGRR